MDLMYQHKSVLVSEVLHYLNPQPGGVYLDVTFGGGGHTRALLEFQKDCSVVAFDWDRDALERNGYALQEEFPGRLHLVWGNFANLYTLLKKEGIDRVDGILADFGTSQHQLKYGIGFSVYHDTPLDMRMSPAHQKITAADVVNSSSEEKLRQIFWQLGEEKYAKQIVQEIVTRRKIHRIQTTKELADIIERIIPGKRSKIHPATRVFQALRMYVNHELDNIQAFLSEAVRVIVPGGRLVVISFHSLEDRLVKKFFVKAATQGFRNLTPRSVVALEEEILTNPSARSAHLRALEKDAESY